MAKYFVYIESTTGPTAQIWNDKQTDGNGRDKAVLFMKTLSPDEEKLSIDDLKKIYILKSEEGQ